MRSYLVIALIRKLIAVRNQLVPIRVRFVVVEEVQQRLPGHRVTVGPCNSRRVAKTVSVCIESAASALLPLVILLPCARQPVMKTVMKVRRGLVVDRRAHE